MAPGTPILPDAIRVDEVSGRIAVYRGPEWSGATEREALYCEYVALRPAATATIPAACVDAMRQYVHLELSRWVTTRMRGDRRSRISLVADADRRYREARRRMLQRLNPVTPAFVLRHLDRHRQQPPRL